MDSESDDVTASHIDKIRAIVFSVSLRSCTVNYQPLIAQSAAQPVAHPDTLNHATKPGTRQSKYGNDCPPPVPTRKREADSGLSSTVQDSQSNTHPDDVHQAPLAYLSSDVLKKLQAMGSPPDFANGTQLISQGVYESIIQRNKSTRHDPQTTNTDTQRSFELGDSGHVDIMSSFVTRRDQPEVAEENEEREGSADSDPSEFSPMPSQLPLTQFRESQRFKTTPAAGVKRTYNGEVVDTPAPVRNPLLRSELPTANGVLELSQAFAATQAPSSPFSNGLPTGPRSDRPSPNLEMQTRPATATSSSPLLRLIPDHKRAATEPATRYVPMKLSQVERQHQEKLDMHGSQDVSGDLEDDFDQEDSAMLRARRQRDRKQQARQELKSLSSPILPPDRSPASSPPTVALSSKNAGQDPSDSPTASPTMTYEPDMEAVAPTRLNDSKAERQDNNPTSIHGLNQVQLIRDVEENAAVLVPKTVRRQRISREGVRSQVDASPTVRNIEQTSTTPLVGEMHSSEPFRIMDSQASQARSYFLKPAKPNVISNSDHVDTGDSTSQPDTPDVPDTTGTNVSQSSPVRDRLNKVSPDKFSSQGAGNEGPSVSTHRNDSVPETSSDFRAGLTTSEPALVQDLVTEKGSTLTTTTRYETAPTQVETNLATQSSQRSSPIRTTPPGRKRRRMLEISAEASPLRLQSQPSFDAEAVLQLDADQQAARLLESSPYRQPRATRTRASANLSPTLGHHSDDIEQPTSDITIDTPGADIAAADEESHQDQSEVENMSPDVSQDVIKPGRLNRLHQSARHQPVSATLHGPPLSVRQSIFDIQASPEGKIVPRLQQSTKPTSTRSKTMKKVADTIHASRMEKRLASRTAQKNIPVAIDHGIERVLELRNPNATLTESVEADTYSSVEAVTAPSMVFAYYKGDPRGYYPARLLSKSDGNTYQIQWEGYDPEKVDAYGIKALDIRIGDAVKVLADGYAKIPYIVRGFNNKIAETQNVITDIRGYQTLLIVPKHRKSLPVGTTEESREVAVVSIYLDVNMWAQLKSRDHKMEPVTSSIITSGVTTPLLRPSTPSTPSSRARRQTALLPPQGTSPVQGLFSNMAFAISYDDTNQKNALSNLVHSNGGMIIADSFHELLDTDTLRLRSQYTNLGFTALLTDRHSRKEKYMQALALGLPCLSGKWIETSIRNETLMDWQLYLLPAGESAELDNATRSRVLPSVDASTVKLSRMLESRADIFNNKDVLMVVGRGKAELRRAPYMFLIQALGANRIHKVPDLKTAKDFLHSEQERKCEWAFVDDKDLRHMKAMLDEAEISSKAPSRAKMKSNIAQSHTQSRCRVAGNELILQSLILGRLHDAE